MNWDAIGEISEGLGAVAVFVTLAYLAMQVRYARTEVARSVSQGRAEAQRELLLTLAADERLGRIWQKANRHLDADLGVAGARILEEQAGLAEEEAFAISLVQMAWWQYRVQAIETISELSPGQRAEFDRLQRRAFDPRQGITSAWYQAMKSKLNPDAVLLP